MPSVVSLVHLFFLKQDMSSYSSPKMLFPERFLNLKRIMADFMVLNSRLRRVNFSFPLIRDAFVLKESSALVDELMKRPENLKLKYILEKMTFCDVSKLFSYIPYYSKISMDRFFFIS